LNCVSACKPWATWRSPAARCTCSTAAKASARPSCAITTPASAADFERIEQLYNLLYLDKYCTLNPHYSAQWLQRGHAEGWLELRALRNPEGRIDGALGWFANNSLISAPIVGYDTALPQRTGLYRQLTRLCLQEAVERRLVLNFSSGAAAFKRLRGGQPQIEYSLIQVAHLPLGRRLVWQLLSLLLTRIGVPLMRTLKL